MNMAWAVEEEPLKAFKILDISTSYTYFKGIDLKRCSMIRLSLKL